MNTQTPMTLTRWAVLFVATYAILEGVTVGLVGFVFRLSFQSLLLPYAMLLGCGLMFAFLTYWARRGDRPKICALRFAITILLGFPIFALVLVFSAISLGLVQQPVVINYFIPVALVGCVIASVSTYLSVRKKAEALFANDQRRTTNDGHL
jgi:hypothetical protein